jgi:hypothetical protein
VTRNVVIPEGQVEQMVAPIPANTRYVDAGAVRFGVEFRELNERVIRENYGHDPKMFAFFEKMLDIDEVGITLHVYDGATMTEHLRFDAFGDPSVQHYHYILPDATHRRVNYDAVACGDLLPWALAAMGQRLPEMLTEAGAAALAEQADPADVAAATPEVLRVARELMAERRPDQASS